MLPDDMGGRRKGVGLQAAAALFAIGIVTQAGAKDVRVLSFSFELPDSWIVDGKGGLDLCERSHGGWRYCGSSIFGKFGRFIENLPMSSAVNRLGKRSNQWRHQ